MPVLRRVELKNFKGFSDGQIEFSPVFTSLVGPNNSGKSTILQAIQASKSIFQLPVADPLAQSQSSRYLNELVARGAESASVRYHFALKDAEIQKVREQCKELLRRDETARQRMNPEDVEHIPAEFVVEVEIRQAADGAANIVISAIHTQIAGDRTIRLLAAANPSDMPNVIGEPGIVIAAKSESFSVRPDEIPDTGFVTTVGSMPPSSWLDNRGRFPYFLDYFIEHVQNFTLLPATRHYPRESEIREPEGGSLGTDGLVALPQIIHLLTTDRAVRLRRLEAAVSAVMPETHNLFAMTGGQPRAELRIAEKEGLEAAESFPAWQVGSGLSQVITCLGFALSQTPGSMLAIEEPELSLHPGAQRRLRDQLLQIAAKQGMQIVVATHTPAFLTGHESLHIVACSREGKGLIARLVGRNAFAELREELGIDPSDALMADNVIVVEGPTEERFYRRMLATSGSPFIGCTYQIIDLGGTDERIYKHLCLLDQATPNAVLRVLVIDEFRGPKKLPSIPSWKIVRWTAPNGAAGEFEDQFNAEELARAMTLMSDEKEMDAPQITEALTQKGTASTSATLKTLYERITDASFSKPALGDSLASVIQEELTAQEVKWDQHPALASFVAHQT